MKKLILVLAIALIATQAFGLTVTLSKRTGQDIVDINYADACSTNLPRTFALDVNIAGSKAVITDINDYMEGESNSTNLGYGIFPSQIDFNLTTGDVDSWGSPLAAQGDIGAKDQDLPSNDVVLEFASLYKDPNAPPTSGRLCSLTIDCNSATGAVSISAIEEDDFRGGVILEDGTAVEITIAPLPYTCGCTKPGQATNVSPSDGATGVSRAGTDLTWTAGAAATDHVVYFGTANPPPKVGIVAMPTVTYATGAMTQGQLYYWHADANNGCEDPCAGAQWSFRVEECLKSSAAEYSIWTNANWNRPSCWCYQRNCRGDADGIKTGLYWVASPDLTILKAGYGKTDTVLKTISSGGVPGICADFDRAKTGLYRVASPDLTILKTYYGKSAANVPCCDIAPTDCTLAAGDKWNFWGK